jgi:hypothetical protein
MPATTWPGVNPIDFSTPIRRTPPTTAPLTTLTTMRADRVRAITPKATMKGTYGATWVAACSRAVRYDWALALLFRRETAQLAALEHPADDFRDARTVPAPTDILQRRSHVQVCGTIIGLPSFGGLW